jgi:hypothetical protein
VVERPKAATVTEAVAVVVIEEARPAAEEEDSRYRYFSNFQIYR